MKHAIWLLCASLCAQTLAPSGPATIQPGQSVPIKVIYSPASTVPLAALQWSWTISGGTLSAPVIGAAGVAAGKSLTCASATLPQGGPNPIFPRCVIVGMNSNTIQAGEVATQTLTVPATQTQPITLTITSPLSASPAAVTVPVMAGPAVVVTVVQPLDPADLNSDGKVDAIDIQIAVDQVLGRSACGSADLDRNGTCEVRDIQEVANRRTVP